MTGVPDLFRVQQLYDNLFNLSATNLRLLPALPCRPNRMPTRRCGRSGCVTASTGTTASRSQPTTWCTAFKAFGSPSNFANPNVATFVDFKGLRKRDRLTVDVPLVRPCAQFPSSLYFPERRDVDRSRRLVGAGARAPPVGTGPFKFVSFTPGQQSVFEANRDYWEHGKPYVDRLVVDSSFSE